MARLRVPRRLLLLGGGLACDGCTQSAFAPSSGTAGVAATGEAAVSGTVVAASASASGAGVGATPARNGVAFRRFDERSELRPQAA